MSTHRIDRARESERLVAEAFRANGWPRARAVAPFAPGTDTLDVPGITTEIKSVEDDDFRWGASLRQVHLYGGLGLVVVRGRGCGPGNVLEWPVLEPLGQKFMLLHQAGWGLR